MLSPSFLVGRSYHSFCYWSVFSTPEVSSTWHLAYTFASQALRHQQCNINTYTIGCMFVNPNRTKSFEPHVSRAYIYVLTISVNHPPNLSPLDKYVYECRLVWSCICVLHDRLNVGQSVRVKVNTTPSTTHSNEYTNIYGYI